MKFLSPFNESFFKAVDYYQAIDRKLALRFIDALERVKTRLGRFPKSGKQMKGYRIVQVKGFPYSVCYCEGDTGELIGLVLYHHKQQEPAIK